MRPVQGLPWLSNCTNGLLANDMSAVMHGMHVSRAGSVLAGSSAPDPELLVCRAQQWLSPQLYLTGRQTERRNLIKEPPSPMNSSSSEAETSAPRRYVRCAIWTPLS